MADLYLGFDLSTQQLKGIVIKSDLKLVHEAKVDFDADFGARYGIEKGVLTNPDEGEIFAPVAMWFDAVDLVLARLKDAGVDFGAIRGIAGAGMQHGTVFWSHEAEDIMASLDPTKGLGEQPGAAKAFSHPFSPNWQDASTQQQCEAFDAHLGGPEKLADVTGSKAHHRFSGPQILRFHQKYPDAYLGTSRISLVSSFLASVFLGKVAPIDIGDVGGMNLWDIKARRWNDELLALAAGKEGVEDLRKKLGEVSLDGGETLGRISSYFQARYGFHTDCAIIPSTGDNPSTLLAQPLKASDAIVSLGTSTTFLMSTPNYIPHPSYHFMNHPADPDLFMFMLCYKNGGLAREHIRNALNTQAQKEPNSWDSFNDTALNTPPLGQQKPESDPPRLGLYFPRPEIVPNVRAGTWRYLYDSVAETLTPVDSENGSAQWPIPAADARAIIESQFLSLRLRSRNLVTGQKTADGKSLPAQPRRIYLVGGGSNNPVIADLAGQVLGGAEGVFRLDIGGNACALGAAYKACWGVERTAGEGFEELVGKRWNEEGFVRKIADGYRPGVWEQYGNILKGFEAVEKRVLDEAGQD